MARNVDGKEYLRYNELGGRRKERRPTMFCIARVHPLQRPDVRGNDGRMIARLDDVFRKGTRWKGLRKEH